MSYAPVPTTGTAPLNLPLYGASIGQAAQRFFKKYATFSGRASRSEFWWWFLISFVVSIIFNIITAATGGYDMSSGRVNATGPGVILSYIWGLATIVPSLALVWRRLHDTNRSGLWIFIGLIPLVGAIVLIVFYVSAPNPAGQRFDR